MSAWHGPPGAHLFLPQTRRYHPEEGRFLEGYERMRTGIGTGFLCRREVGQQNPGIHMPGRRTITDISYANW